MASELLLQLGTLGTGELVKFVPTGGTPLRVGTTLDRWGMDASRSGESSGGGKDAGGDGENAGQTNETQLRSPLSNFQSREQKQAVASDSDDSDGRGARAGAAAVQADLKHDSEGDDDGDRTPGDDEEGVLGGGGGGGAATDALVTGRTRLEQRSPRSDASDDGMVGQAGRGSSSSNENGEGSVEGKTSRPPLHIDTEQSQSRADATPSGMTPISEGPTPRHSRRGSIPDAAQSNLDDIAADVKEFKETWEKSLEGLSPRIRTSSWAQEISEINDRIFRTCKDGSTESPKVVTSTALQRIRDEIKDYSQVVRKKFSELAKLSSDDSKSLQNLTKAREKFVNVTKSVQKKAVEVWNNPEVEHFMQTASDGIKSLFNTPIGRNVQRHARAVSKSFVGGFQKAAKKGGKTGLGMHAILAASKLAQFETQLKNRYKKVKRDVKDTLVAHMEASLRDFALVNQVGKLAKIDLHNYDFVPFVATPVLLWGKYYATLSSLFMSLLYIVIIMILLTFEYQDSCDDGIQYWFGFKMCLEILSAVFSFWTFMQVRAWTTRYEEMYAMAEEAQGELLDKKRGEINRQDNLQQGEQAHQLKMEHMISQGQDSVETFQEISNSFAVYANKVLLILTIFYDVAAIEIGNRRHCQDCGTSALEFAIYAWSFWILLCMTYRVALVSWDIYLLSLKCRCCRIRVLDYADSWDDFIGFGVLNYLARKILFISVLGLNRKGSYNKKLDKKLKRLLKEQTSAMKKCNDISKRVHNLRAEMRLQEREEKYATPVKAAAARTPAGSAKGSRRGGSAADKPLPNINDRKTRGLIDKLADSNQHIRSFRDLFDSKDKLNVSLTARPSRPPTQISTENSRLSVLLEKEESGRHGRGSIGDAKRTAQPGESVEMKSMGDLFELPLDDGGAALADETQEG